MSTTTIEHGASIDLSQLLTFNVGFKNLEMILQTILVRLDSAEAKARAHDSDNDKEFAEAKNRDDELKEKLSKLENKFNDHATATNAALEKLQDQVDDIIGKTKELEKGVKQAHDDAANAANAAAAAQRAIDEHCKLPHGTASPQPPAPILKEVEDTKSAAPHAAPAIDKAILDRIAALENGLAKAQQNASPVSPHTSNLSTIPSTERHADPEFGTKLDSIDAKVQGLEQRIASVADAVKDLEADSNDRFDNLNSTMDRGLNELKKAAPATHAAPPVRAEPSLQEPVQELQRDVTSLQNALDTINNKLDALAAAPPAVHHDNNGSTASPPEVTAAQFKLLKVSVDALERAPKPVDHSEAIRELQSTTQTLKHEIKTLGSECTRNHEACLKLEDTKANKSDIPTGADSAKSNVVQPAAPKASPTTRSAAPSNDGDMWRSIGEANKRVEDLQRLVGNLDGKLRTLDADKGDKAALAALQEELNRQRAQLAQLASERAKGSSDRSSAAASEAAIAQELQRHILPLVEEQGKTIDWTKGQVLEIRATIEHIHHSKADASLVANKAERDFVENSMEKLMREVEQVLNATNAGLIDTLDKSLNILRDMIDGKATKQDVNRLQSMINEDSGAGSVPEGLTGFKGYRCLGCNRTLEGMRQRPMGNNFTTFMNRLPNGPKAGSSHGTRPTVSGPTPPAGYIANTPQSH